MNEEFLMVKLVPFETYSKASEAELFEKFPCNIVAVKEYCRPGISGGSKISICP